MKKRPDKKTIHTIKDTAQKITGAVRREFQAAVTLDPRQKNSRFSCYTEANRQRSAAVNHRERSLFTEKSIVRWQDNDRLIT